MDSRAYLCSPRPRRGIPYPWHKMPTQRPVPTLSAPAPGRAVGRTRLAQPRRLSPSRHCPTGGNPRPRRVGFALAAVNPFRHISEWRRALQSQTKDGAARALRGLPAALRTAGESFFCLYHQFIERQKRIFLQFPTSFPRKMPEISGGTRKLHLSHAACHIR